jgi:hypothetical protein
MEVFMAYRRPSVQLTQEYQGLVAALALFNLANCIVGPAYRVHTEDALGTYTGIEADFAYASQVPGTIVDIAPLNPHMLRDAQFPIAVTLTNVLLEVISQKESGAAESGSLTVFRDARLDAFQDVSAGDILTVIAGNATVLPARLDGRVSDSDPNLLETTIAGLFTDVQVGDMVVIGAATGITAGTYYVQDKISNQALILHASFYTGIGTFAGVPFIIERETGVDNQGSYVVREKLSNNAISLRSELLKAESFLIYNVRKAGADVELARDTDFTADLDKVTVMSGIQSNGLDVVRATILADYRALRVDLASSIREYKDLAALESVFGVGQIVPANPLAFGLSLAMQNAVTATNGIGLSAEALGNEQLAYVRALDVLKKSSMYCLVPLTQNPAVHTMFSAHVTQMSTKQKCKWRVAICNRSLVTTEVVSDDTVTSGFRAIVNTRTDGVVVLGDNKLVSAAPIFGNVQKGDKVVVVGGTGAATGEYVVTAKNVNNMELTLGGGFIASYSSADVEYWVKRDDGLEANGVVFYDSNATFIDDGVAPGHKLVIAGGAAAGTHSIIAVDSNNKIRVAQVPGITSVQGAVSYHVYKDLTLTEQAQFQKAYAQSFRNRRLVLVWPDVVEIPDGALVRQLPGYFLACAPAALTTGLPTQQGFTNLTVSGFTGTVHASDYFDDEQLDLIAEGGTMIYVQDVEGAPLYCRHELSTDTTAIKFQEYMFTKNVDFVSYFLVQRYKGYIGQWNVYKGLFDAMTLTASSAVKFLKDNEVPQFGGIIRGGKLTKIGEGAAIDTAEVKFRFDMPVPLNNIDITIVV